MEKKKKIYIFCLKPPICSLIKKRFAASNYLVTCVNPSVMRDDLFDSMGKNVDCIIIDIDIKPNIKDKIKRFFRKLFISKRILFRRYVNGKYAMTFNTAYNINNLSLSENEK